MSSIPSPPISNEWIGRAISAYIPPPQTIHHSRPLSDQQSTVDSNFEHFFRQYERRVTGYLWRMTGDIDATNDLCQDTFMRAWQQFDRIANYDRPIAWLLRVATNLALNQLRHVSTISLQDINHPAMSDPGNHQVEQEIVRQVLASLPEKQRAMLILREVYGYHCQEIGKILDMSTDAVKKGLCRAREQFRHIYLHKGAL
jgi:RNA polymerase sigma-70 factor, ECF subfamily